MDITNQNFLERLPEIAENIGNCDFIAIDTELSGLMRERGLNMFDLPEERYAKAFQLSRGYFIMQFGLSCFTKISDLHYSNATYNFYIFPQANGYHGDIDRTFSVQAHAIQFLSEHGFDFNKLFKHGVSYLTFQEKQSLTSRLKLDMKARSKISKSPEKVPSFVPNTMTKLFEVWLKKINKFIEQRKAAAIKGEESIVTDQSNSEVIGDQDSDMTDKAEPDPNRFELRDCSSNHKRNLMKRVLECQSIIENIEISSDYNQEKNETYFVIKYVDKCVKEENQKNALTKAKGFLEVLELMILSRKPIVGHNLVIDLIQIIDQFMEPLTNDYNAFKEICHSLFPIVYDTKFIAHSILDPETLTKNQSRLHDLYCQLRDMESFARVQIDHHDDFLADEKLPHQAGYDAYMSGYSFLVLCETYVQQKKKYKFKKEDSESKQGSIADYHQVIDSFANKVYLSYSYDLKYLDLSGDEERPDRQHVFYIEFPQSWVLDDIFQVFHPFGGVSVSRTSKTSALCALRQAKNVGDVVKKASKLREGGSQYSIYTYETYLQHFKPKAQESNDGEDIEFRDA